MIQEIEIVCQPGQQEDEEALINITATALNLSAQKIAALKKFIS